MADVFISYAHSDEVYPDRWVSTLHRRVSEAIDADYPDANITILRDATDFRKAIGFDYQIRRAVEESSVLLCIVSPSYVTSTYCQLELDHFVDRARLGNILRVIKKPVKITAQPEALQNLDGPKFCDDAGDPLQAYNDAGQVSSRFDNAVGRLVRELVAAVEAARAPRQRVLLFAAAERSMERDRILNELRLAQVEVLTQAHLPRVDRDLRDELARRCAADADPAKRIDFAVLLFGSEPSSPLQIAYEAMRARCAGPERRCLSSPSSIQAKDPAFRDFLAKVRHLDEPPGYVCHENADAEALLVEARRYLKALENTRNPVPTLFLQYPKSARGFANEVRARLRAEHARLAPNTLLHLSDAYGDGDAVSLKTQPETRDAAVSKAHGGLLLQERPGAFLAAALEETESLMRPARTGKPIAVYPANAGAIVPRPILEKYPAIVDADPPYAFIGQGALRTTLAGFLQNVYAQAAAP